MGLEQACCSTAQRVGNNRNVHTAISLLQAETAAVTAPARPDILTEVCQLTGLLERLPMGVSVTGLGQPHFWHSGLVIEARPKGRWCWDRYRRQLSSGSSMAFALFIGCTLHHLEDHFHVVRAAPAANPPVDVLAVGRAEAASYTGPNTSGLLVSLL